MKTLTRRRLLAQLLAIGAGGFALLHAPWSAGFRSRRSHSLDVDRLWRRPRDRESARVIGRFYLDAYPDEAAFLSLATREAVLPCLEAGSRTEAALREALSRRVRVDFERGEVVRLQGWILSRTEARLAALAALA